MSFDVALVVEQGVGGRPLVLGLNVRAKGVRVDGGSGCRRDQVIFEVWEIDSSRTSELAAASSSLELSRTHEPGLSWPMTTSAT